VFGHDRWDAGHKRHPLVDNSSRVQNAWASKTNAILEVDTHQPRVLTGYSHMLREAVPKRLRICHSIVNGRKTYWDPNHVIDPDISRSKNMVGATASAMPSRTSARRSAHGLNLAFVVRLEKSAWVRHEPVTMG
jgi:hypothetical protein